MTKRHGAMLLGVGLLIQGSYLRASEAAEKLAADSGLKFENSMPQGGLTEPRPVNVLAQLQTMGNGPKQADFAAKASWDSIPIGEQARRATPPSPLAGEKTADVYAILSALIGGMFSLIYGGVSAGVLLRLGIGHGPLQVAVSLAAGAVGAAIGYFLPKYSWKDNPREI